MRPTQNSRKNFGVKTALHRKFYLRLLLVFFLGFGMAFDAVADPDPDHDLRERVREIVRRNSIASRAQTVSLGLELRSICSQSVSDRRVVIGELQGQVAGGIANYVTPEYQRRAFSGFLFLDTLFHPWTGQRDFETLMGLVRKGIRAQAAMEHIVQIVRSEPALIGRVFETLENQAQPKSSTQLEVQAMLLFALERYPPPVDKLNRDWGPHFSTPRWQSYLQKKIGIVKLVGLADQVGWIRSAFVSGLRAGNFGETAVSTYLSNNGGRPVHPEIRAAIVLNSELTSFEFAARDDEYGRRFVANTTYRPAVMAAIVAHRLGKNPSDEVENAVAKLVLPTLINLGEIRHAEGILAVIIQRHEDAKTRLPPEVQKFVLNEFVRSMGPNTFPSECVERDLLLRGVQWFDHTESASLTEPHIQAAIIALFNSPEFSPSSHFSLMNYFANALPFESYTPETKVFYRQNIKRLNPYIFTRAGMQLVRHDRLFRNEVLAGPMEKRAGVNTAFIAPFYDDFPEVKAALDRGNLEMSPDLHGQWIREHGIPGADFMNEYIATPTTPLDERTADPLLLLAGPTPQRHLAGAVSPVEIPDRGSLRVSAADHAPDELELTRLEPAVNLTGSEPGLPSVSMFFGDQKEQGSTAEVVYRIINRGNTGAGINRIQSIRQGHTKRTDLLDAKAEFLPGKFLLDPIPGLAKSYADLQARLKSQRNSSHQGSSGKISHRENALPPLTAAERASVEALARVEILSVIAQTNPVTEIILSSRSRATFGQSASVLSEPMTQTARSLNLPLRDILPSMPDPIERRSITLSPERLLSQPPYAQQYFRLVNQRTEEARQKKAQSFQQPENVEVALWRGRQMDLIRVNLRRSLEAVMGHGHGELVYISQTNSMPPEFETTGYFQGKPIHGLIFHDLEQIDVSWNTLTHQPNLLIAGQPVTVESLQYLPHLPPEMSPDAVSVYYMTEPDARRPHGGAITEGIMVRETLFRRSIPLLLKYYAEGARILNQTLTSADDLQFQLNHFVTQHERTRSIRWIPEGLGKHAIAIEALLWNQNMSDLLYLENRARNARKPSRNIADAYMKLANPVSQKPGSTAAEKLRNVLPTVVRARPSIKNQNSRNRPLAQPEAIGGARNSIPSEHVLHHVSYRGYFSLGQMPQHFLLGERADFRNTNKTKIIEVPSPPSFSLTATFLRGWSRNYPALVNVRSQAPWNGGTTAGDALLPRPEDMAIAHLEVTDLQGAKLTAGQDYDVLLHEPTGEYAVRLRPEVREQLGQFHVSASYQPLSSEAVALTQVEPAPDYQIDRLRPVINRARAAGFTVMADKLDELIALHQNQNRTTVPGRELETTVRGSAFYSYRSEHTFPGAPSNAEDNEFSEWAKFIAEDATVCAQCDATNGIFGTFLGSYHGGDPQISVQPRVEYSISPGSRELRVSDLHARVHELHRTNSGPLRRVVYDVTPHRRDPRSKHGRAFQRLRTESHRVALGVQSHMMEWWRRTKNVFARAAQIISERRAKQMGSARSNPNAAEPSNAEQLLLNGESPIQPLPSENAEVPAAVSEVSGNNPPAEASTNSAPVAPTENNLGETLSSMHENRELLTRELPQLRRVIQNLGGHAALDPREGILLAERLARTYQRLTENDLTLPEAVAALNSIAPALQLSPDATGPEVRSGFRAAATEVMGQVQIARRMDTAFPHYRGTQGEHIQTVMESLLSPFGIERASPAVTTECIVQSLQNL